MSCSVRSDAPTIARMSSADSGVEPAELATPDSAATGAAAGVAAAADGVAVAGGVAAEGAGAVAACPPHAAQRTVSTAAGKRLETERTAIDEASMTRT